MVLGGLSAASYVTLVGMGQGLASGGSPDGGFCLLARETCAMRLAHGITYVDRLALNPARALLAPLPGDARRRLPTIWCLGDAATLLHNAPLSPLGSDIYRLDRDLNAFFPGDAEMSAQFGRVPLVSPPAPALGTGAASARPLL